MDNMNRNMLNLIASFKKTGQSDDVIKQSLWQMGMIPDVIDSHLEYYNKHTADCNRPYNVGPIVKENNNNMELTLENLYKSTLKAIDALKEMRNDDKLGFSSATAQSIIENNLSKLNISNDNEVILQECIKAGKKIEDTLVNPVLKYAVAEGLFYNLTQYDWIMPVSDLRKSIFETFEGDKWGYVAAKFARKIAKETSNKAFETLYESLIDTLIDEDNKRLALKNVLLENIWNSEAKGILSSIVAEEKAEQGEINTKIYENNNCSIRKNFSPCLVDGNNRVFFLNGKNYIYDGKKIEEAKVTDRRYLNVLEGLSLMKYEEDKNRLVYYGKNDMLLEYNCSEDKFSLTGVENFSDMSLIDMNETLKRCGIFDRETIQNCEKLVKFYESRSILTDLDTITTISRNDVAGVMVSIINVEEGIVVNKVNLPFNYNEMVVCESATEACKVIKDFITTHHGKGKTKYFYISWKNEHPGEEPDESLFTYPGPNPFTKEQAVLMMADAVEAASRSLPEYTEESISNLVNKIIDSQVDEGYFRECPITFKDIATVKNTFKEKLKTIYHTRISYPELKK